MASHSANISLSVVFSVARVREHTAVEKYYQERTNSDKEK